jgi:galactoside O-acetyltransferase
MIPREKLEEIGFKKLGKNVMISDKATIYSAQNIEIGDNVRIDDFCVLSPGKSLRIGSFVHIACFCSIIGKEEIVMEDFSGLSSRVSIYSSSDDYSGSFLTNPTVSSDYTNVYSAPVTLNTHVIVGAGAVILPGVVIGEGAAVGSMSLVSKSIPKWEIWGGSPAKKIKERKKDLLVLEWKLRSELK